MRGLMPAVHDGHLHLLSLQPMVASAASYLLVCWGASTPMEHQPAHHVPLQLQHRHVLIAAPHVSLANGVPIATTSL